MREASHMSPSLFTRMSLGGGSGVEEVASVINLALMTKAHILFPEDTALHLPLFSGLREH